MSLGLAWLNARSDVKGAGVLRCVDAKSQGRTGSDHTSKTGSGKGENSGCIMSTGCHHECSLTA